MGLKQRLEKLEQVSGPKGAMLIIVADDAIPEAERDRAIAQARARGEGIVVLERQGQRAA